MLAVILAIVLIGVLIFVIAACFKLFQFFLDAHNIVRLIQHELPHFSKISLDSSSEGRNIDGQVQVTSPLAFFHE